MKCPHCNKQTKIDSRAFGNADTYGNSVVAVTHCCNKAVYVIPIRKYEIAKYTGNKTEDDWGEKIANSEMKP